MYLTRLGGLLAAYQRRDPAARSKLEIFLLYPGVHAVLWHRAAHWLYLHHRYFLARWISQHARNRTGIEIHPGATRPHSISGLGRTSFAKWSEKTVMQILFFGMEAGRKSKESLLKNT